MIPVVDSEPRDFFFADRSFGTRWRRRAPGVSFSVVFHAAVLLAFVYLWHHMVRDFSQPEGIPVEIVSSVPGEGDKIPSNQQPGTGLEQPGARPDAAPPPSPPPSAEVTPDPVQQALALPSAPPSDSSTPLSEAAPQGRPPDRAGPRSPLAEPPPEPKAAATQPDRNVKANAADPTQAPAPAKPEPPPPAPDVLTAHSADSSVDVPSADPASPRTTNPNPPASSSSADADAAMAAALPMSSLGMPSSFRAVLSAQGSSAGREYKGVVYGALSRAKVAMEMEARQRRMKGQVVVLIALSDSGAVERVSLVQSSGSAETDAFAMAMVRRAGPFPAPPPGTPHTFTPAISFGDE